jgi:hypothetical protein
MGRGQCPSAGIRKRKGNGEKNWRKGKYENEGPETEKGLAVSTKRGQRHRGHHGNREGVWVMEGSEGGPQEGSSNKRRPALGLERQAGRWGEQRLQGKILPTRQWRGRPLALLSCSKLAALPRPFSLSPGLRLTGLQLLWVLGGFE